MFIDIGTRLGSHEITSLLGRGGVGEVYRALDTRLNRPVAIKFLSDDLADANARRRFQREAQTASSLNHPHIVTVYDIGEHEGKQYIVTEFVDGGTLKDWAKAEKRNWKLIVELVIGVADGLAAAHQAGILHRDIKPANVLVAKNGYAKLADFGLAKLLEDGPLAEEAPTVDGTRPGIVVGTVAYMSPEQASGRPLDVRSDIFSFGVLLHELLSGRLPFGGSTDLEILKTIIHGLPEPLGPEVPSALRGTVEKALEKDPTERYQSMRDFVVDLRRSIRQTTTEAPVITAKPRRRSIRMVAAVAGALVAIAIAAGLWLSRRPAAAPENLLADATFTRLTDFPGDETGAAISPDGKFAVFLSDRDGRPNLWINQVGTNGFRNLTNSPFLANPRGQRPAGFTFDGSQLWLAGPPPPSARLSLLPLVGGSPQPFLPDKAINVSWSPDGKRLVYNVNTPGDPLFVAESDGSNAQQLFVDSEGLHNHFPTWSADGKWIYFVHGQVVSFQFDLWRISVTGGTPEQLTHHNGFVGYPTPIDARTILYVAEDQNGGPWLWAVNAETKSTRRVTSGVDRYYSIAGSADARRLVAAVANPVASLWSVPILDRIADAAEVKPYNLPTTRALAPRFAGGSLYYLSSLDSGDGLWRFKDGQASEVWKVAEGTVSEPAAVSPDGVQIAIVLRQNGKQRLRLMKVDGSEMRRFAETLAVRGSPTWSPDGKWIATGGNDGTEDGLFKIPVEGGAPVRLAKGLAFNPIWSPKDPLIVYGGPNVAAEQTLLAVRPDGSPVDFPAIKTYGEGALARFSADGNSLIYVGRTEALVDFRLLDLATGKPRSLAHIENPTTVRSFDISPDGKQIVFDRLRINSDIVLIDLPKK